MSHITKEREKLAVHEPGNRIHFESSSSLVVPDFDRHLLHVTSRNANSPDVNLTFPITQDEEIALNATVRGKMNHEQIRQLVGLNLILAVFATDYGINPIPAIYTNRETPNYHNIRKRKAIQPQKNFNKSIGRGLRKREVSEITRSYGTWLNLPLLTPLEEILTARQNKELAKKILIERNIRFVIWLAKPYRNLSEHSLLDLVQEGLIGLSEAAEKFNWRLGFKFSTHAKWFILRNILRAIPNTGLHISIPVHEYEKVSKILQALKIAEETGTPLNKHHVALVKEYATV